MVGMETISYEGLKGRQFRYVEKDKRAGIRWREKGKNKAVEP